MNSAFLTPVPASVVVLRIQDFARKPVADQVKLKARLEAIVGQAIKPLSAAGRIVLDAPDGLAVVVPGSARAALALAERSQKAADIALSIVVNHGPVKPASDALRGSGLVGDGLASGMVLASAAAPGRFVASRSFREALKFESPARAAELRAAGTFTDANVRTHELFTLDRQPARTRRRRLFILGTLTVAGIIGAGFAARYARLDVPPVPKPPPVRAAVIHLQITPRGDVYIDGVMQGSSPPLTEIEVFPGPHMIEVRNTPNPPLRLELSLGSGEEMTITHAFARPKSPARAAPKAVPKPKPKPKRVEKKVEKKVERSKTPGDYWRQFRRDAGF